MVNYHRHPYAVIVLIILIIIFSTVTLPRALGQEGDKRTVPQENLTVPPLPEATPNQPNTSPLEQLPKLVPSPDDRQSGHANQSVAASLGDHCNPDFWIVSSRTCKQRKGRCGANCDFVYIRRTPDDCLNYGDRHTFRSSLKPGVPVCIVIHGSFTAENAIVSQSDQVYRWIRAATPQMPLHVVFFTWPSQSKFTIGGEFPVVPSIDVSILGRRGGFNGVYLAQLIGEIPSHHRISLFGHSHGARTASSALHLLAGGEVQGNRLQFCGEYDNRIRAVLVAAAIDHNWLNPGSRYGCALRRAECLLSLRNKRDLALAFYPLQTLFVRRSLARSGFTKKDRQSMGWLSSKASELDVTHLIRSGHMIPNYIKHPSIAYAISPYLYFSDDHEQTATSEAESATVMK